VGKKESILRSIIKSITWRIIAIIDTIIIVLLFSCYMGNCNVNGAITIGFLEFFFKFVFYYLHERVWQTIKFENRSRKHITLIKTFTWRLIATIMTIIIVGKVLSDSSYIAVYIALVEVFTKTLLYYIHERLWLIIPLGKIKEFIKK